MMIVRPETEHDHAAIDHIIEQAFGQTAEVRLVQLLRQDEHDEIGLVAETDEALVGHIMLSPMTGPAKALGLAPVSVLPAQQGKGIGSALIKEAIKLATEADWEAIFLLGEPAYYERFGFRAALAAPFSSPYSGPYFMALELKPGALKGKSGAIEYAPAFSQL
jgi:putative acetyltransferase